MRSETTRIIYFDNNHNNIISTTLRGNRTAKKIVRALGEIRTLCHAQEAVYII